MFSHTSRQTQTHLVNHNNQRGKWCLVRDGDESFEACLQLYDNFKDYAADGAQASGKRMEHDTTHPTFWKPGGTHCQLFEFIVELKQ